MEIMLAWFGQAFGLGLVFLNALFLVGGALIMRPCRTRRARLLTAGIPFGLFVLAQLVFFLSHLWLLKYLSYFVCSFSRSFTLCDLAKGLWILLRSS